MVAAKFQKQLSAQIGELAWHTSFSKRCLTPIQHILLPLSPQLSNSQQLSYMGLISTIRPFKDL